MDMGKPANPLPEPGTAAPDFALSTGTGEQVALSDFRGRPVVLYFYPKDDTPGCTVEAKAFRDALEEFEDLDAVVLGVSPDEAESHSKFTEKFGLNFPLLCDEDHRVAELYGVWVEKNRGGKKAWGVQRATFLVDRDGTLVKVWPRVKAEGHAEDVLNSVQELAARSESQ
jgi:thioredoxin-dependent peroxiredoxin